ncbi:hypothetical protein [Streptomyces sp. NPDC047315]|uniref:hypothetical protein n=1 Tax=Streptomyces sp. NPDC047315 TaxID=3155142 RepID=UPI0034056F27
MNGPYLAEVTAEGPANGKLVCVKLGSTSAPSPRLALRWLRDRARSLADGMDPDPAAPWFRATPGALFQLPEPGNDAPTDLRRWCADEKAQADALSALASGYPVMRTVTDDGCSYTFAIWPVLGGTFHADHRPESSTAGMSRASP